MEHSKHTIHANRGKIFDCACVVGVECDSETIALRFLQLEREDDNIGPMVYACVNGTTLHVRLCDRDDVVWDLAWDEEDSRWRLQCNTPDPMDATKEPAHE